MVYKIENSEDLEKLPLTEDTTLELLCHHAKTLEEEYGKGRVEGSDGGYVLFASPGTKEEELKAFFDVSETRLEYVNRYGNICEAFYCLNNDYVVAIIMSITDAPTEIVKEIDN